MVDVPIEGLGMERAQARLDAAAAAWAGALGVDGPALLRERAGSLAIAPGGTVSAGGSCRLLRARDRWVAMNLARPDDVESLEAWMGNAWTGDVWDAVGSAVAGMGAAEATDRAQLLGIPTAVATFPPVVARPAFPIDRRPRPLQGWAASPVVVDLSALWAGPLCARLLGGLGARVVKVEDRRRRDGARRGSPAFWSSLNGEKELITLDLRSDEGPAVVTELLDHAAVVVTSGRPRGVEQLGLELPRRVAEGLVWVAITGYGYVGPWRDRVAFGDDAAVAGGLAVAAGGLDAPVFVGDAPADPLAGLYGAHHAAGHLEAGRGAFVDVAMRDVVATALQPW
jgi:CoA transferase family III